MTEIQDSCKNCYRKFGQARNYNKCALNLNKSVGNDGGANRNRPSDAFGVLA